MHVAKIRQGVPHVVGQAAARVLLQGPNHRKLEVLVVMQAGVAAEAHQKNQIGASGALYHATAAGDRTALAHAPGQYSLRIEDLVAAHRAEDWGVISPVGR
jgi:hypothetical protein